MSQSPVNTLRRKKKLAPAPPAGAQKMSFLHSESHNVKNNNNDVIDLKQYSHYPVSEKVSGTFSLLILILIVSGQTNKECY